MAASASPKFVVIGHRGNGMNMLPSDDHLRRSIVSSSSSSCRIKENTITSFNAAGKYPIRYIEFDVQVTKDDCPIIFHDNFIYSKDKDGKMHEKRVTDLSLSEFLSYGLRKKQECKIEKPLFRKTKDGKIVNWNFEIDDTSCTLQEAFQNVNPSHLGFNIELKFDENLVYQEHQLLKLLKPILQVVTEHAKERPIIYSTFQPDTALLVRKLQNNYPVYFLTNAGNQIYSDTRRNTLEEAIKVCLEGGLKGIVSEVKGIFKNPGAVQKMKEAKLSVLTYGKLNNVAEAVYMQYLMGVEGVIVDLVQEITESLSEMTSRSTLIGFEEEKLIQFNHRFPQFSQTELSFLRKLIQELIQQ